MDGAIGSLQALRPIAQYLRRHGKTVIFDSGIRNGSDVIKALGELRVVGHEARMRESWQKGMS